MSYRKASISERNRVSRNVVMADKAARNAEIKAQGTTLTHGDHVEIIGGRFANRHATFDRYARPQDPHCYVALRNEDPETISDRSVRIVEVDRCNVARRD